MDRTRRIKVALSQRIIPHYRVPVFSELSRREGIDLTVFYGRGFPSGSQANASKIEGFKHKKLATIFLNIQKGKLLRVLHPALFFHLVLGRYDAVIAEPTTNFYNDLFIFLYCKLFRKKFIWYDSGSESIEKRTKFRRMIDPIVTYLIRHADSYITYTSYADDSLVKYYGAKREIIFRAQNTVDTSDYDQAIAQYSGKIKDTKMSLGLEGCKVSLYIGGIEKRKKINNLITATANLNKKGLRAKTLVVGDGLDQEWVFQNMSEFEKHHAVFAGKHIDDAVLYILLSDVVVLPSQGGLSVSQAFACGKPFIGSEEIEHGGIRDYVQDDYNGFLVRENDITDLESSLERVFSDDQLYQKLVRGALETSKKITVANMVDGIVRAVYHATSNGR
jgi:glycosyltransferase involved in cell wall biosynthesis